MTTGTSQETRVYEVRQRVGLAAAGLIAGGSLFLLVLIAQFVLLIATPGGKAHEWMPGMIGGLSVVGIGMLARGTFLLRSIVRVAIGPDGLWMEGMISRREVRWDQIDRLERSRPSQWGGKSYQVIDLVDASGKKVATIPDTITGFEDLAADITARSTAARGRPTFDPQHDQHRQHQKTAKQMRLAAVLLGLFAVGLAAAFIAGVNEELHKRRFSTDGVEVQAKVIRLYMVRVTPRLEFEFKDEQGRTFSREAMLEPVAYDALIGEKTVPVRYLRSDPSWNQLIAGEQSGAEFGGKYLLIFGFGFLICAGFFVLCICGIDVKTADGRVIVTRRGKVIREWGAKKEAASLLAPVGRRQFQPAVAASRMPLSVPAVADLPGPPIRAPRDKPRGIVALGIVCIVFGAMGVLFNLLRLLLFSRQSLSLGQGRAVAFEVPAWLMGWTSADLLLAALLIVTGGGLLAVQRWARLLAILVAAIQVVSSLGAIASNIVTVVRSPETSGPEGNALLAGIIGGIILQIVGTVFPIVILIVLSRRHVGEAFARKASITSASRLLWRN